MSEDEQPALEQIERWEKAQLRKLRTELFSGIDLVLANDDGFTQLLAISDEEWQQALDAEAGENAAS
jgi:hypothetical protein